MEKLIELLNRIAVGTGLSNGMSGTARNSRMYGNAAMVLAYACLVHELQPVLLVVAQGVGRG